MLVPEFLTLDDLLKRHLTQIKAMFGGQYLHGDLFEMAAAYLFHVVQNHPFIDGNKRIGLEAAMVFLDLNGHAVDASIEELVDLTLQTAQGQRTKQQIAEFFRTHVG